MNKNRAKIVLKETEDPIVLQWDLSKVIFQGRVGLTLSEKSIFSFKVITTATFDIENNSLLSYL